MTGLSLPRHVFVLGRDLLIAVVRADGIRISVGLTDVLISRFPFFFLVDYLPPLSLNPKPSLTSLSQGLKESFGRAVTELGSRQPPAQPESGDSGGQGPALRESGPAGSAATEGAAPERNWARKTAKRADPRGTRFLAPAGEKREALPNGRQATRLAGRAG